MLTGDLILHDGTGTTPLYTPPFSRRGEAAVFSLEATNDNGSPTMVVTVEHRNEDDTAWGTAGTFGAIAGTGVSNLDISSGLKELIRFAFTFSAGAAGDFYVVVIAPPAWRPY